MERTGFVHAKKRGKKTKMKKKERGTCEKITDLWKNENFSFVRTYKEENGLLILRDFSQPPGKSVLFFLTTKRDDIPFKNALFSHNLVHYSYSNLLPKAFFPNSYNFFSGLRYTASLLLQSLFILSSCPKENSNLSF